MKNYVNLITKENNNHIILFVILNMILVLAETISIALIPLFIDVIVSPDPILPNYFNFVRDFLNPENKNELLNFGIIFFTIVFLVKNFFYLSVIFYQASLKKKFNNYLKKKFLKLYIFAPFETMKAYNTSEILRNTDTEVQNYVTNFFDILKFSKDFLLLFSIFLLLLIVDIYSTIIALIFLIFCIFLYFLVFYDYLNKLGLRRLTTVNAVYQWINQTCGAIKEIKITKKENKVLENFSKKVNIFEQSKKITEIISALPVALFEIVFVIIVLLLIKFLSQTNSINALPALSLYIIAFIRLLPIVSRFGSSITILRSFNPSVKLLNDEINKLEKYSKPDKKLSEFKNDTVKFEKNFELNQISFKYRDGNQNIFENFNHKIDKGKSIAFLGKSGSGKTTLINIICGLLSPTSGEILVDGVSINKRIVGWQKNIGLISQDNYLLDDTLENNIIFLNDKDTVDSKKLKDAIFYSGVSDFLNELKDGLNTKIGEKGSILSGGQIQRVALARLLYRDPKILILDEFTNSLDPVNEDFILEKLKQLQNKKNKTYVIISHKLKPLKICDEIIILEKGKISEQFNYFDFYKKYHLLYD
tara:strand:- start:7306 stop:9072 length:1767 start_codon:yes stop_codon:yes gene_type:complete